MQSRCFGVEFSFEQWRGAVSTGFLFPGRPHRLPWVHDCPLHHVQRVARWGHHQDASFQSETSPEENLKQIFRVFDINNDGTITLKVSRIWSNFDTNVLRQELQKIVKDLFLLINETNADKASQEVLVKTGGSKCTLVTHISNLPTFSVPRDGREPRRSGVSKRVHRGVHGPEEVQHDAHVEDHRRLHRRGHLEQSPAAAAIVGRTPDLVTASRYLAFVDFGSLHRTQL